MQAAGILIGAGHLIAAACTTSWPSSWSVARRKMTVLGPGARDAAPVAYTTCPRWRPIGPATRLVPGARAPCSTRWLYPGRRRCASGRTLGLRPGARGGTSLNSRAVAPSSPGWRRHREGAVVDDPRDLGPARRSTGRRPRRWPGVADRGVRHRLRRARHRRSGPPRRRRRCRPASAGSRGLAAPRRRRRAGPGEKRWARADGGDRGHECHQIEEPAPDRRAAGG